MNALLAWYFVAVWGSGYVATKIGLQYAPPFTFLKLRFCFRLLCLAPIVPLWEPKRPQTGAQLGPVGVAGRPLLAAIACLVIFASFLAVSVLHVLMRHGEATRVASMMYLPPIFAVALELALFHVLPSALTLAGIAVTCIGVAMTVWTKPWKSPTSSC